MAFIRGIRQTIGSVLTGNKNDTLSYRKVGEVGMSLDDVIRCLGINFLLMGYLVCATLVHIAINSSKILNQLEKMSKDKQEGR